MNEIEFIVELKDFPDYFISTRGRVFSEKRGNEMREKKQRKNIDGYLLANLYKGDKRCTKTIHRLVGETFLKRVEDKNEIDHINRNKLDNRIENLRWCSRRENNINKGIQSNNTSGVTGVYFHTTINKWRGSINIKKKKDIKKTFKKKEDAIKWRLEMEKKYYN